MQSIGATLTNRLASQVAGRTSDSQSANSSPSSFVDLLGAGVNAVNNSQQDAHAQVAELMTGGDVSQIEVMSAVQKADMSFRMLVQVRNKMIAAYEEINAIRI